MLVRHQLQWADMCNVTVTRHELPVTAAGQHNTHALPNHHVSTDSAGSFGRGALQLTCWKPCMRHTAVRTGPPSEMGTGAIWVIQHYAR